jgi:DNA-binding transcriptional LysR family regulator
VEQAVSGARPRAPDTKLAGKVRVALIDIYASHWLTPKLPLFWKEHPGLQVEILTGLQQADLSRGEAELAIRHPRPRQRELSAVRIATGAVGLFGTTAIRARWPVHQDLAHAKGMPLMIYPGHMDFLQSAAWFRKLAERAVVRLTSNNIHTLLAAAIAGHGAALLPRFVASKEPSLVDLAGKDASRHDMWLVSHPEFRRDPRVAAMADFLKRQARGPEGIF